MHVIIIGNKGLVIIFKPTSSDDVGDQIGYVVRLYVETQKSCSITERVDGMSF